MDIKRYLRKLAELGIVLTAVTTLIVAGCGWVDGTANVAAGGGTGAGGTIAGVAVLGHVHGGTATAYAANPDGSHGGTPLGSGPTDSNGKFSFSLSSTPAGPLVIEITGGSYASEFDGSSVPVTKPFAALLPSATGVSSVAVTPLSDMAYAFARAHAAASGIGDAITAGNTFISTTFHLGGPPTGIVPDFSSTALTGGTGGAATDGGRIALAIAALDAEATKLTSGVPGLSRSDAYSAFSADMSLGTPGASAVSITSLGGASSPLPVTTLGNDLAKALVSVSPTVFGETATASAVAAVTATATDIGASVTAIIPKSVLSATGVSSSSSGAMSYTSISGHQYLFIAARDKGVRKVDITDPASAVEVTTTSTPPWNGAALSLDSGFNSQAIGGAMVVSGSTGVQVLAFAYGARHIALLDPVSGNVNYEGDLPLIHHTSTMSFSGGSAYIAGAIPDPGKGAWLATTDGYIYLDINATLAAGTGAAPVITEPLTITGATYSGQTVAENLGGWIANNLLFTPSYAGVSIQITPPGQTGGLAKGTYNLDPSYVTGSAYILNGNMDGGSVDTGLGVGILTYEDDCNVSFINLNGIAASAVPSSTTAGTFLPPANNGYANNCVSGTFSGTAVDSKTHQVLGMAGYSTSIFVGQLQDPASVAPGAWVGMSDWVSFNLNTYISSYSYATDPHANATVFNTKTGKTYGYVLDGATSPAGVVQIDMSGVMALENGTSHNLTSSPTTSGAVLEIPLGP